MARSSVHKKWGVAAGLGAVALNVPKGDTACAIAEFVGAALGGRVGGVAPDVVEPALTPNHRAFAHSLVAAGLLAAVARENHVGWCYERAAECRGRASLALTEAERGRARSEEVLWHFVAGLIIGFLAGYASHLVLDADTPRGLPLLGLRW